MQIRKATVEDLSEIQRLNLDLFKFEKQFTDSYSLDWTFSERGTKYFSGLITGEKGIVFVTEVNNKIVGYIAGYDFINTCRVKSHMAEIDNMFVGEEFRRQDVGSQLVLAFENEAKGRGVELLRVGALAKNFMAHNFYKKKGFFEHEVVFEKEL